MAKVEAPVELVGPRSGSVTLSQEQIGLNRSRLSPELRRMLFAELSGFEILKQCTNCDFTWTSSSLCFNVVNDQKEPIENKPEYSSTDENISGKGLLFCGKKLEYCLKCKRLEVHNHYSKKGMHSQKLNLGGFSPVIFNNVIQTCKSAKRTSECKCVTLSNRPRSSPAIFMARSPEMEEGLEENIKETPASSSINSEISLVRSSYESIYNCPLSPCETSYCVSSFGGDWQPVHRNTWKLPPLNPSYKGNSLEGTSNCKRATGCHQGHDTPSSKVPKISNHTGSDITFEGERVSPMNEQKVDNFSLVNARSISENYSIMNSINQPELKHLSRHGQDYSLTLNGKAKAYDEDNLEFNVNVRSKNEEGSKVLENGSEARTELYTKLSRSTCRQNSSSFASSSEIEEGRIAIFTSEDDVFRKRSKGTEEHTIAHRKRLSDGRNVEYEEIEVLDSSVSNVVKSGDNNDVFLREQGTSSCERNLEDSSGDFKIQTLIERENSESSTEDDLVIVVDDEILPKKSSDFRFDTSVIYPKSLSKWTNKNVVEFLENTDCNEYAAIFGKEEIDGKALDLLDEEKINKLLGIKIGPAMRIVSHINKLKEWLGQRQDPL